MSIEASVGQIFSYTALTFGILFFLFAIKYYVAILLVLFKGKKTNGNGKKSNHNDNSFQRNKNEEDPFVSIHLPFYNEKNVAQRIIQACIDIDYTNYEVLVIDDSRDETIEILKDLSRRRGPPTIKFVHRKDRQGFKGGALSEALRYMDYRTEYIMVFDADFIPPQNIIKQFLWYFGNQNRVNEYENGNNNRFADKILNYFENKQINKVNSDTLLKRVNKWYEMRRIAAVQGYQLHNLNKSENWITKGVRAEFSGSYMIERVAEEFFGAMKMIAGSVFMLKADIVKKLGWTTSITEDWDLTIRLYLAGYKVIYTTLIQTPAEIPKTIQRLVKQRMRWSEGHTFAVKKYFWEVIRSQMITFREKLEFLYFAPYYLQSLFFLVGTFCWMIAELLNQHPWFWTATFGWCLVLSNQFALPLMSLTGLFLERNALVDFKGILSSIVLSYILTPFQAYAALKGLLEKNEGGWVRTFKTGTITDKVLQIRIRRYFSWILPKKQRQKRTPKMKGKRDRKPSAFAFLFLILMSSLIVWVTVAAMSTPEEMCLGTTALTFEYELGVVVNSVETDRILTHPDYTDLSSTPQIDSHTISDEKWNLAWSFYLYGPLEKNYQIKGKLVFNLYLYSSIESEVDIIFKIRDVDPQGKARNRACVCFGDVELMSSPSEPIWLESKCVWSMEFKKGHTILVEIWLKSDEETETTYYFEYDSVERHSLIEFPGIVVPESVLPFIFGVPLIPVAVLEVRNKRDERC